jgi:hypothetical protein
VRFPVIGPFSAARARALLAAIVGLLTICALLQPLVHVPGAQAAPPTSRRFGAVEAYRASELARDARIGWERIIFSWRSYQPDGPDQWNENHIPPYWLWRAESEGREVVGVLISTPGWATAGGGRAVDVPAGLDLPVTDGHNYWAQYVRRLATQYKGRVNTWVVWNEPDITDPSHPGYQFAGSVSDYYKLVRTAYVVAKSVAEHQDQPRRHHLLVGRLTRPRAVPQTVPRRRSGRPVRPRQQLVFRRRAGAAVRRSDEPL